jgi:hypothetical protein
MSETHWVDQTIANHRAGVCMCGRDEGVQYGPSPFGYGNCCVFCQREWERQHGGVRWESNASQLARLRGERARAALEGRGEGGVVRAWNRSLPPFERPQKVYEGVSDLWRQEYEAWADREGMR